MDEFDEICRRCTPVVYRFLLSLCKDASLADELTGGARSTGVSHIDTFLRQLAASNRGSHGLRKTPSQKSSAAKGAAVPTRKRTGSAAPDDIFELLADKEQAMRIHASLHRLKEPVPARSSRCACSASCTFATLPTCSANPSPGQRSHFTAPRTN